VQLVQELAVATLELRRALYSIPTCPSAAAPCPEGPEARAIRASCRERKAQEENVPAIPGTPPTSPPSPEREVLVEEWKDVRENLRYFGNKRFAQLTVFIAASAFLFDAFLRQNGTPLRLVLAPLGILLTVVFLVMETSSKQYSDRFAARGKEIEMRVQYLELMHRRPENDLATWSTYAAYALAIVLWLLLTGAFLLKLDGVSAVLDPAVVIKKAAEAARDVDGSKAWSLRSMRWDPSANLYQLTFSDPASRSNCSVELDGSATLRSALVSP
jgi:hypothetical protein